tara:strand:- start:518 stop:1300 length:783 start_codon:yes stop_codon:yes gene_type:complete
MMQQNKQVAIITGATKGIGRATVVEFLKNNINCVLVSRKIDLKFNNYLKSKFNKNDYIFVQADISKIGSIKKIIDATNKNFGKIDILFNNAAYSDFNNFFKNDLKMYEKIFNTNVRGLFLLLQAAAKEMIRKKIKGNIINVSSQAGRRGEALVPHYCASKAAVISYTQSSSLALAKFGIRVNAISPGVIDTPLWDILDKKWAKIENLKIGQKKKLIAKQIPLGRIGKPEEVAELAYFLTSNKSKYITGQTINIDGGAWFS